jgi:hypothetical protein
MVKCNDCQCEIKNKSQSNGLSVVVKKGFKHEGKSLCGVCYEYWKRSYGVEIAEPNDKVKKWNQLSWIEREAILWQE